MEIYYDLGEIAEAYEFRTKRGAIRKAVTGWLASEIRSGRVEGAYLLFMYRKDDNFCKWVVPAGTLKQWEMYKVKEPVFHWKSQPAWWTVEKVAHQKEKVFQGLYRIDADPVRRRQYELYQKSPEWKATRERRKRMDNFTCQKCGAHELLQVHHLTYEHLGNELMEDLITLCRDCHHKEHFGDNSRKRSQIRRNDGQYLLFTEDI